MLCRRYDLENAAERDEGEVCRAELAGVLVMLGKSRGCEAHAQLRRVHQICASPSLLAAGCLPGVADVPQSAAVRAGKIKALAKQFGKWHGISSLINLGTLVAAVGHGYWLAGGEAHRSCCAHLSLCCRWKRLAS